MSELRIYESDNAPVSVRLEGETVWLTQRQMASLFGTTPENILMHLKKIFHEGELDEPATTKDFLAVQTEGRRQVQRTLKHYNLDAIISVGYRVNSRHGVRFRQWATRVLREHLSEGYTLNQARLAEQGLTEVRQAIDLLARTLGNRDLVTDTGQAVVALIAGYAKTWRLLLRYDEGGLTLPAGCQPARGILDYKTARAAIEKLKAALIARGEATDLFGRDRGDGRRAFSATSSKACLASRSTKPARKGQHIFCTSSSRTIRSWMETNGRGRFCSCSICNKRAWT